MYLKKKKKKRCTLIKVKDYSDGLDNSGSRPSEIVIRMKRVIYKFSGQGNIGCKFSGQGTWLGQLYSEKILCSLIDKNFVRDPKMPAINWTGSHL